MFDSRRNRIVKRPFEKYCNSENAKLSPIFLSHLASSPKKKISIRFRMPGFLLAPIREKHFGFSRNQTNPLGRVLGSCMLLLSIVLAGKKQTSLPSLEAVRFDLGVDLVTASSLSFLSLRGKKASEFFLPSLINKIRGKIIVVPLSTMVKINFALNRLNACRLISLAY